MELDDLLSDLPTNDDCGCGKGKARASDLPSPDEMERSLDALGSDGLAGAEDDLLAFADLDLALEQELLEGTGDEWVESDIGEAESLDGLIRLAERHPGMRITISFG